MQVSSDAALDSTVATLTSAVAHAGGTLSATDSCVPFGVVLRSAANDELGLRFYVRSAGATLERVLEMVALAQWRCQSGSWSTTTGLLIRIPNLPATTERWTTEIDRIRASSSTRGGPIVPLAICSLRGGAILRLPGLQALVPETKSTINAASAIHEIPRNDVSFAILKVLLAASARHRDGWWGGPTEPITTGVQLAQLIGRSSATAYATLDALASRGWMRKGYGQPLRLLDVAAAVTWWLDYAKHQRHPLIPVRPVYGDVPTTWESKDAWLRALAPAMSRVRWAIGGWSACQRHGFGVLQHPQAKPFTVTVACEHANISPVLQAWSLVACDARDAAFWLAPVAMTSAALAAVVRIDDIPVVDGWQAALDVASDPDRGIEQATAIADLLWLHDA